MQRIDSILVGHIVPLARRIAYQATWFSLVAYVWFLNSPLAWAKTKKPEPVEIPTKSYFMPYVIVFMLLGVGLMTVCRPSSRADKMDDKAKKAKKEEDE